MSETLKRTWWVVGVAGLSIFMAMLDASIVIVALPTIESHFGSRPSSTEWVVLGYTLALAGLVLPTGRWLERVGRRASLTTALAGFALTSLLAALAPGMAWLIGARIAQGAFGAGIFAVASALAAGAVPPERRGRAMGIVGALGPLGAVSGPALGGWLLAAFGWPAIFLVNLPVAAVTIVIGFLVIPRGTRLVAPGAMWFVEAALLSSAVVAGILAFTFAPVHGAAWLLLLIPAAGLVLAWTRLPVSKPMVGLVRTRGVAGSLSALTLATITTAAVQFLSPYYLERFLGAKPTTVGLTVLAFPLLMGLAGPVGGIAADRFGVLRTAVVGLLVQALAVSLTVPVSPGWRPFDVGWRLALLGVGNGLFVGPNQAALMTSAPRHLMVSASAAGGLARSLAFSFGPAMATAVWALADYRLAGIRTVMGVGAVLCGLSAVLMALTLRTAAPAQAAATAPQPLPARPTGGPATAAADQALANPAPVPPTPPDASEQATRGSR